MARSIQSPGSISNSGSGNSLAEPIEQQKRNGHQLPIGPTSQKRRKLTSTPSSSCFSTLTLPHPLGLRPFGNSLLAKSNARIGLGFIRAFPDDLILHLLSKLDSKQLSNLSATSHAFYVFANQEQLWKDLFLKRSSGHLKSWQGSWKRTYLSQYHAQDFTSQNADFLLNPNSPIKTKDLFSDVLFHPFRMSFTPLSVFYKGDYPDAHNHMNQNLKHIPIPRIKSDDHSVQSFTQQFSLPSLPCIIEPSENSHNGPSNQSCLTWTYESMLKKWSDRIFRAEAITTTLQTYVQYSRSHETHFRRGRSVEISKLKLPLPLSPASTSTPNVTASQVPDRPFDPYSIPDDSPFYLFDSEFPKEMDAENSWLIPELLEFSHMKTSQIKKEELGDNGNEDLRRRRMEMDLFGLLGDERPEYRWIIAGPERSGSGWHKDPNSTSAWNTPLTGRKAWLMLPDHIIPPGVYISEDESEVTAPLSIAEWILTFYEETLKRHGPKGDGKLKEGICGPGETMFVPKGWWHAVINLEECIALTQNFISKSELSSVLYFFKNKSDQVSGFQKTKQGDKEAADDEDESFVGLFEMFSSRLKDFDVNFWEEGMKGLDELEQLRAVAKAERLNKTTRIPNGSANGGWWERLKTQRTDDAAAGQMESELKRKETITEIPIQERVFEASRNQKEFSFSLDLGEDELEQVPW